MTYYRGSKPAIQAIKGLPLFMLLVSSACLAQKDYWHISEADMRLLPPFCRTDLKSHGVDSQGTGHLCPGLNALNDAQRTTGEKRQYALSEAIDHLTYTIGHTSATFPLKSTVFIKRGTAYELQGNRSKAISDYRTAISLSPKNLNGYVYLSEVYLKIGDKKTAVQVLDEGLKIRPDAKILLDRKKKITGV